MGKTAGTSAMRQVEAAESDAAAATAAVGEGVDLEAGIASIFAAIRSGAGGEEIGEVPEDSGITYDLLARLDQLWQAAGPGDA